MSTPSLPPSFLATLPGRYYHAPDIFELEQDRLFQQYWYAFTHVTDVQQPGKYRTAQVGRENVLVVRGNDGELRAFLNVCRHRGTRLCMDEYGETKKNFRCTYHAWTYGLDGGLVAAPHLAKMPDVDRTEWGLKQVWLREYLGYVWVCLADEPPSFEDTVISPVSERFGDAQAVDNWTMPELKVGRRISYDVKANWKVLVENFLECYHCATMHPEFLGVIPEYAEGYAAQYYVGRGVKFGEDVEGFTVDGKGGFGKLPGLTEEQDRQYWGVLINPQFFVSLVPDHVIAHRMFPVSAHRTIVECDWLYAQDVPDEGPELDRSVELFHRVNQQDFAACERCQVNMGSKLYEPGGVLVPHEHQIASAFHDWFTKAFGEP
ncbi:aromatic ring-hydroxylating dioxygenase subunit alpha [Streptomyces sp. NPDC017529]|uniref:aromatic ring-hydroxylating dioxygenase subunit alpha n=1 Tax=Streptomyces sp. NPDC017529 TaxID=3365000 RepID=UPI003794615D